MTTREGSAASAALPRADAVSTGGTYRAALQTLGNATFSAAPQRPRDAFDLIAGPPREHRATILRVLEIVNSVSYRRSVPGTWIGTGFNQIWRPFDGLQQQPPQDRFLELNETSEILQFVEIQGDIPNRGCFRWTSTYTA